MVKNGYTKTYCIGLPIIYTPIPKVERIKDSLLIMPSHSLVGCETKNIDKRGEFLDEILAKNNFKTNNILAYLHSNDIKNNFWVNELSERGIAFIEGAKNNDKNAYKRLVSFFSQFEYMITNDFGSHVMYALYLGVKVAILNFPIELKALEEEVNQRIFPETGMSFEDLETLKKEKLISLFTNLTEAKQNFEIGNYYVGLGHKKIPSELKKTFGF